MLFPNSDFVGVAELQRGWLHVLTRHEVGSRNIMNARAVAANVIEKSTDLSTRGAANRKNFVDRTELKPIQLIISKNSQEKI